ncbi:MAG: nucleotide pyrophosphohydrolase [Kiritimatiellae bacterium]|jgi:NTP pyrophosphatase (non-canonical NTP hydrolase)|nr:nucleotide pyrophosphohydrolase [Kiritimatiellia bacterium]MDD4118841.1 nucleotide pyrophosphohydrolase [Kiritimatiellia bacterium]NCC92524.1 nucleotide pyrophosphohydrolase [Opitutae bacterium]
MKHNDDWKSLRDEIVAFRDARDWAQFHTPKNLAAGISIEAAELLEHFLWCTDDGARALIRNKVRRKQIAEELADVVNYALLLANAMEIDLPAEIRRKIRINARKYPVRKSKGIAKKYTEL